MPSLKWLQNYLMWYICVPEGITAHSIPVCVFFHWHTSSILLSLVLIFWLRYLLYRLSLRSCLMNGYPSCVTIVFIGKMRLPCTLTRSPCSIPIMPPRTLLASPRDPLLERYNCATQHAVAENGRLCLKWKWKTKMILVCFSSRASLFHVLYLIKWIPFAEKN